MRPRIRTLALLATVGLLAVAACQSPDGGGSSGDDGTSVTTGPSELPTQPTDGPTSEPTEPGPTQSGPLDDRSQAAVDDLTDRLGVDVSAIEVGQLEEVTWSNGAIGCPQPGQAYTEALVPGIRLILTVEGTEYAYHGKGDEPLFYCADPIDPVPSDDATA